MYLFSIISNVVLLLVFYLRESSCGASSGININVENGETSNLLSNNYNPNSLDEAPFNGYILLVL